MLLLLLCVAVSPVAALTCQCSTATACLNAVSHSFTIEGHLQQHKQSINNKKKTITKQRNKKSFFFSTTTGSIVHNTSVLHRRVLHQRRRCVRFNCGRMHAQPSVFSAGSSRHHGRVYGLDVDGGVLSTSVCAVFGYTVVGVVGVSLHVQRRHADAHARHCGARHGRPGAVPVGV